VEDGWKGDGDGGGGWIERRWRTYGKETEVEGGWKGGGGWMERRRRWRWRTDRKEEVENRWKVEEGEGG